MAIHKTGGSTFWVSPTAVDVDAIEAMDAAATLAFYLAINDWVEVEEVENLGTVGDSAEAISFTTIGRNRVRKIKGPRDAGNQEVVVGRDPLDDGQEELIEMENDDFNYPFKIIANDARTSSYSNSAMYYAGLVMSKPTNFGPNAQVTTRTFNIGINTSIVEIVSGALAVPVNLVLPSIIGSSLAQAAVLTADEGSWSNSPTSYTYQWQADTSGNGTFVNISGATARTHTLAVGQAGDAVRVQVTAVNPAGSSSAANSLSVGLVGA